jgi:hypothetical protein
VFLAVHTETANFEDQTAFFSTAPLVQKRINALLLKIYFFTGGCMFFTPNLLNF